MHHRSEVRLIVIHCRFRIDPTIRDAWTESARRMALASRAEEGCIAYDFSFDVIDPDIAYAYEAWETQETLDAHIAAPHHVARMAEVEQWDVERQQILFYGVEWQRDVLAERAAREDAH
jgi:quinol monooxygenase YgiN